MQADDSSAPRAPSRASSASMLPSAAAAAPARPPSAALEKELAGFHAHAHAHANQLLPGPAHAADRLYDAPAPAPPAFSVAPDAHAWLLADGYAAFLSADTPSPWDPADYVYSSAPVPMQPAHAFGHMLLGPRAAQPPQSAFAWPPVPVAAETAPGPGHEPAVPPRRNSSASSCAGSSCSSACVYGTQCDIAEPCELGDECGLDQPCDASDCGDELVCADDCCPAVYTCEETKAAATLASFVASDPVTQPSPQRHQLGTSQQPTVPAVPAVPAVVADASPVPQHAATHCDGPTAAPQTVIQHLIERHNDPSAESCVRPCLVDQPLNYAVCPMPCLVEHPQLHGHEYPPLDGSLLYPALDDNCLVDCCNPALLASDCTAHWTSGDELLQHWHMQHRAMFLHSLQQQQHHPHPHHHHHHHHHHQLGQPFDVASPHERLHTPPYISSRDHPLTAQARLSLASSPTTTLASDLSPMTTPPTGASTTLSPQLNPQAGHCNAASSLGDDLQAAAGVNAAPEALQCLWCETPGGSCCGQTFDSPKDLNIHVISCHVKMLERSDGGYVCGWQGCKRRSEGKRGFPQKSKIERHVQTHTGEKPYECPTCHITFSAKQALDQHELIHKGSKPLPCEFPGCDKTFRQQSARTMHMRTHTKVKPLACNICGRRFSESSNLSKHRRTHAEVGAFECGHQGCSKTFHRLDQLRRHQKTHEAKIKIRRGGHRVAAVAPDALGDDGLATENLAESASTTTDMSESEPM